MRNANIIQQTLLEPRGQKKILQSDRPSRAGRSTTNSSINTNHGQEGQERAAAEEEQEEGAAAAARELVGLERRR